MWGRIAGITGPRIVAARAAATRVRGRGRSGRHGTCGAVGSVAWFTPLSDDGVVGANARHFRDVAGHQGWRRPPVVGGRAERWIDEGGAGHAGVYLLPEAGDPVGASNPRDHEPPTAVGPCDAERLCWVDTDLNRSDARLAGSERGVWFPAFLGAGACRGSLGHGQVGASTGHHARSRGSGNLEREGSTRLCTGASTRAARGSLSNRWCHPHHQQRCLPWYRRCRPVT